MNIPRRQPAPMPHSTDIFTHFRRRWYCPPPASRATRFRVTSHDWTDNNTIQNIYAWEPINEEGHA